MNRSLPGRSRRSHRGLASLLVAMLAAGALATAASAAGEIPPPLPDNPVSGATAGPTPDWAPLADLHLRAVLGLPCVFVQSTGGAGTVRLSQKRGGSVVATGTFDGSGGGADVCLKPVRAGDRLVARRLGAVPAQVHSARVPTATLKLRPAANTVTGAVWDDTDIVHVRVQDRTGGIATVVVAGGAATLSPGTDRTAFTFSTLPVDLGRGDPAAASVVRNGDEWVLFGQTPSVTVRVGSASVLLSGPPGSALTVTLRSGVDTLGTATAKLPLKPYVSAGRAVRTLRSGGVDVPVQVGQTVSATGLAGSLTVPDLQLSVDKLNNSADFTCPPGSTWMLAKDELIRFTGVTVDGPVHVDGVAYTTPTPSGKIITAWCQLPSGFAISAERIVP